MMVMIIINNNWFISIGGGMYLHCQDFNITNGIIMIYSMVCVWCSGVSQENTSVGSFERRLLLNYDCIISNFFEICVD